jgi:hypothetical protein
LSSGQKESSLSFILQKAFSAQTMRMRGLVFTALAFGAVAILGIAPETASARESEQAETTNCACKPQRRIVRPMTEATPIRKKDKDRVRRILM